MDASTFSKEPSPNTNSKKGKVANVDDEFASAFASTAKSIVPGEKSKYAKIAQEEHNARQRLALADAAMRENILEKKNAKFKNDKNKIYNSYYCTTCEKQFSFKPKACIFKRHKIRKETHIEGEKEKGVKEKQNPDIMKGGLKLGAGIEWDGHSAAFN